MALTFIFNYQLTYFVVNPKIYISYILEFYHFWKVKPQFFLRISFGFEISLW
jgi:hypothetical protein